MVVRVGRDVRIHQCGAVCRRSFNSSAIVLVVLALVLRASGGGVGVGDVDLAVVALWRSRGRLELVEGGLVVVVVVVALFARRSGEGVVAAVVAHARVSS